MLLSDDEFLVGDTQGAAADALGRLVGEPLMEAAHPAGAAREWLASHPEAWAFGAEPAVARDRPRD